MFCAIFQDAPSLAATGRAGGPEPCISVCAVSLFIRLQLCTLSWHALLPQMNLTYKPRKWNHSSESWSHLIHKCPVHSGTFSELPDCPRKRDTSSPRSCHRGALGIGGLANEGEPPSLLTPALHVWGVAMPTTQASRAHAEKVGKAASLGAHRPGTQHSIQPVGIKRRQFPPEPLGPTRRPSGGRSGQETWGGARLMSRDGSTETCVQHPKEDLGHTAHTLKGKKRQQPRHRHRVPVDALSAAHRPEPQEAGVLAGSAWPQCPASDTPNARPPETLVCRTPNRSKATSWPEPTPGRLPSQ